MQNALLDTITFINTNGNVAVQGLQATRWVSESWLQSGLKISAPAKLTLPREQ